MMGLRRIIAKRCSQVGLLVALLLVFGKPGESLSQLVPSFGRDRAGTSGFQFLKVPVDPRSAAMGETVVTNAMDASAMYWNPALLAQIDRKTVIGFSNTQYYTDVQFNYVAAAYQLGNLRFGANVQTMDSGEMEVTTEFQPFGTGEMFKVYDFSVGLTVAQALTDLFSYGVTGRYVEEGIASVKSSTVVFDAGIFYRIGTTGAQMAVAIKSFGFDASPSGSIDRTVIGDPSTVTEESFEQITPPTTFLLGLSYNILSNSMAGNSLIVSGQLINPNDNAESFNVGAEYVWNRLLSLRGGYRLGVEEVSLPSFGIGITVPGIAPQIRFDYGFNSLDRLGSVHRVGIDVQL